ncbi:MAG: M36 family metallopeptidase [Saprospiraceae bacterium]|nr:M36 family metallopeptidase [Candidatus Vicinibacter affinis]
MSIINVLYISNSLIAQNLQALSLGKQYLEASKTNWNLTSADLKDLIITDQYVSDHNGVTHIYFQQAYKGIPIYNAVTSVHVTKEGKVFDSPCRFIGNIESKVNATQPRINALQALEKLIFHYDVKNAVMPVEKRRSNDKNRYFEKTNFTHSDIPARLMYFQTADGKLRLTWDVSTDFVDRADYWSTRVDAITGEILDKHNYTVKCSFSHQHHEKCVEQNSHFGQQKKNQSALINIQDQNKTAVAAKPAASVYNVFPIPVESPLHGNRQLVTDPAYPNASPFGWHDTNGQAGPEFTITRGNNVNAYLDRNGDNAVDAERADGGASLNFDFPFDSKKEPASYTKAAVTNLFYVNNMMHDVLYQFGFDEKAGNFQQNNYNKGGTGADQVLAEAQDGSGTNNADFATLLTEVQEECRCFFGQLLLEVRVDAHGSRRLFICKWCNRMGWQSFHYSDNRRSSLVKRR